MGDGVEVSRAQERDQHARDGGHKAEPVFLTTAPRMRGRRVRFSLTFTVWAGLSDYSRKLRKGSIWNWAFTGHPALVHQLVTSSAVPDLPSAPHEDRSKSTL
jgi:hypothetical protein